MPDSTTFARPHLRIPAERSELARDLAEAIALEPPSTFPHTSWKRSREPLHARARSRARAHGESMDLLRAVVETLTGTGYRWYETRTSAVRERKWAGATCGRGTTSATGWHDYSASGGERSAQSRIGVGERAVAARLPRGARGGPPPLASTGARARDPRDGARHAGLAPRRAARARGLQGSSTTEGLARLQRLGLASGGETRSRSQARPLLGDGVTRGAPRVAAWFRRAVEAVD